MNACDYFTIDRLTEQIISVHPKIVDNIEKELIKKNLQRQLIDSNVVVSLENIVTTDVKIETRCKRTLKLNNTPEYTDKETHDMGKEAESFNESVEEKDNFKVPSYLEGSGLSNRCRRRFLSADCAETIPTAVRKSQRKRIKSSKYIEEKESSKNPIIYCSEEEAICNRETPQSLHIEIPRLFLQGKRHHLFLGNKLSDETVDDMAKHAKKTALEKNSKSTAKPNPTRRETITSISDTSTINDRIHEDNNDSEFAELVREVIPGNANEEGETWGVLTNLEYIHSSDINIVEEDVPMISKPSLPKKRRHSSKPKETTSKRVRKSKYQKDSSVQTSPKSNLAEYLVNFSNDSVMPCETPPASSSTISTPRVSSTTQCFDYIDQQELNTVTCYIEGDWPNDGPYQIISANGLHITNNDVGQVQPENVNGSNDNLAPFQQESLEENLVQHNSFSYTSMLQSNPLTQTSENVYHHGQPIFNIQIPTMPVEESSVEPTRFIPPAHTTKDCAIDLSLKGKYGKNSSMDVTKLSHKPTDALQNFDTNVECEENGEIETLPLNLSVKAVTNEPIITSLIERTESPFSFEAGIDRYNSLFLCIENLDFDKGVKPHKGKDMPRLNSNCTEQDDNSMIDNLETPPLDSNYITMNENNSQLQNFKFDNQSDNEILDNLLATNSLNETSENLNEDNGSFLDLNESEFVYSNNIKNSITLENADSSTRPSANEQNFSAAYKSAVISDVYLQTSVFNNDDGSEVQLKNLDKYDDSHQQNVDNDIESINIQKKMSDSLEATKTTIIQEEEEECQEYIDNIEYNRQATHNQEDLQNDLDTTELPLSNNSYDNSFTISMDIRNSLYSDTESMDTLAVEDSLSTQQSKTENEMRIDNSQKTSPSSIVLEMAMPNVSTISENSCQIYGNERVVRYSSEDLYDDTALYIYDDRNIQPLTTPEENSIIKHDDKEKSPIETDEENISEEISDSKNSSLCIEDIYDDTTLDLYDDQNIQPLTTPEENSIIKHDDKEKSPIKTDEENISEEISDSKNSSLCIEDVYDDTALYIYDDRNIQPLTTPEENSIIKHDDKEKSPIKTDEENISEEISDSKNSSLCIEDIYDDTALDIYDDQNIQPLTTPEENSIITHDDKEKSPIKTDEENISEEISDSKNPSLCLDMPNMSVLEVESKLNDDILDYESDMDDVISLTASSLACSPNGDRLMESLTYVSVSSSEDFDDYAQPDDICTTGVVNNSISSNNVAIVKPATESSLEDLKNFKIPKLKSKNDSSDTKSSQEKLEVTTKSATTNNREDCTISAKLTTQGTNKTLNKQGYLRNEKRTRNSPNDSFSKSNPNIIKEIANDMDIPLLSFQPSKITSIQNIFGITCLPYLVNNCSNTDTNCPHSHQLKDVAIVYDNLNSLDTVYLSNAYKFMYKHEKLFENYFMVFCKLYAIRGDRKKLMHMVIDCDRYPQFAENIVELYESLISCGLHRTNACRHILLNTMDRSCAVVDALVAIVMKSDWTIFTDYIMEFAQGDYYFHFGTLQLMFNAVSHKDWNNRLKSVFIECLLKLHSDDAKLLENTSCGIEMVAVLLKKIGNC